MRYNMESYKVAHIPGGPTVLAQPMPSMKSVALGIWIRAGGRFETPADRGISHFVEHLLFKGTKKRSVTQIKHAIEGIGGSLNGFTSEEVTCYLVKVLGSHLSLGLDVLSDMVLHATCRERDVEKERTVVLEEIKMYRDHPDHYVHDVLAGMMWRGSLMETPLIGTHETVTAMTRRDLVRYKTRMYTPANSVIVACGDVRWKTLVEASRRAFTKAGTTSRAGHYPAVKVRRRPGVRIVHRATEQTHVALGFHAIARGHRAHYALDLLNIILGANMSSRLFHEIREKRGLAYAISSHVSYYRDTGAFIVEAGIDNKKVIRALQLILKEIGRIVSAKVSDRELRRAKEYLRGNLAFTLEKTVDRMLWLGKRMLTNDEMDHRTIVNRCEAVTAGEIQAIARTVFSPANLSIAAVGPLEAPVQKQISELAAAYRAVPRSR